MIPTGVPGKIVGQIVKEPNSNTNDTFKFCTYDGKDYNVGDTWESGCDYRCRCLEDAVHYECTERCIRYLNVPGYCTMVVDPDDSCCRKPLCPELQTLQTPTGTPTAGPELTPTGNTPSLAPGTGPVPTSNTRVTPAPKPTTFHLSPDVPSTPTSPANVRWWQVQSTRRVAKYHNACLPQDPTGTRRRNPELFHGLPLRSTRTPRGHHRHCSHPYDCPRAGNTYLELAACTMAENTDRVSSGKTAATYNCICLDETTGYYECKERCPTYPLVPSQCELIPNPTDFCCNQLVCDWSKPTPNPMVAPTSVGTLVPNPNLHTTVSPPPGEHTIETPVTGPTPTNSVYNPPTLAPEFTFCVYNGVPYRQGQRWYVGCEKECVCDDSTRNYYTCTDRCPSYANLGPQCTLTVNPSDACCRVPECYAVPTLAPGVTPPQNPNGNPTPEPVKIPTGIPGIITGQPNTPTTEKEGCMRAGVHYKPGETWQEGCSYNCECVDKTGRFKCTERCVPYPNIPAYCVMIVDPTDKCCTVPDCPGLTVVSTPSPLPGVSTQAPLPGVSTKAPVPGVSTKAPVPGVSTQAPIPGISTQAPVPSVSTEAPNPFPKEVCVFGGKVYTQGQQWYSGCEKFCVCEDAKIGFYRCSDRCAHFDDLSPDCKLVPDPRDPSCCVQPQCGGVVSTVSTV
ncbi:mucin-2-like [Pomacea canaliculata]|uniref:mucin-2-like n=1 Tax=Pomacea canaliculata TaxID=400727 RepID=UPI000D73FA31|nr:mucin-2-like [Pomacea canaliculata]